jgi:predicted O-methyltransferase YrrM
MTTRISKNHEWHKGGELDDLDKKWIEVDEWTFSHTHTKKAEPHPDILVKALKHQQDSGLPDIAVSPSQGKFLLLQAKIINAQNILEVGTLGGFSTIFLANASPTTKITTVEYNPHHAKVARENLEMAGLSDRVEVLEGAGTDVLPLILKEVQNDTRPKFDFVFIDADKVHNWEYFDLAVDMSRPGACVIVDNVVRRGTLIDPMKIKTDQNVIGSRRVIEKSGQDPCVDSTVIQMVGEKNYDGFLVAVVKRD